MPSNVGSKSELTLPPVSPLPGILFLLNLQAFSAYYYTFHFLNLTETQPLDKIEDDIQVFCARTWDDVSAILGNGEHGLYGPFGQELKSGTPMVGGRLSGGHGGPADAGSDPAVLSCVLLLWTLNPAF